MKERLSDESISMRVAKELGDGMCVNVGASRGVMTQNYLKEEKTIIYHSENGALAYGRLVEMDQLELMDYNFVDAVGRFFTPAPGMSFGDFAESFDCLRTGRVDLTILGAYQVSEMGDLANWSLDPEASWGNIGGAMDMPIGAKKVFVTMPHVTKDNKPKIVKKCSLPLTAPRCVSIIFTDVAVVEVREEGLILKEIMPGWTVEEIQAITEPKLIIAEDLKEIQL